MSNAVFFFCEKKDATESRNQKSKSLRPSDARHGASSVEFVKSWCSPCQRVSWICHRTRYAFELFMGCGKLEKQEDYEFSRVLNVSNNFLDGKKTIIFRSPIFSKDRIQQGESFPTGHRTLRRPLPRPSQVGDLTSRSGEQKDEFVKVVRFIRFEPQKLIEVWKGSHRWKCSFNGLHAKSSWIFRLWMMSTSRFLSRDFASLRARRYFWIRCDNMLTSAFRVFPIFHLLTSVLWLWRNCVGDP